MKALLFDHAGTPGDVLRLAEIDPPRPAPGEVLVRVLASSINPADAMFIAGTYALRPHFPQVAGMDGVGTVEGAGEGAALGPGVRVAFRHVGVWAERVAVPVAQVVALPAEFPVEKGAQLILNAGTAWGLLEAAGLKDGGWLAL